MVVDLQLSLAIIPRPGLFTRPLSSRFIINHEFGHKIGNEAAQVIYECTLLDELS